jgi:hypothetical protein
VTTAEEESITTYGFIRSRKGGHPLPSGKMGLWGHSCEKPIAFRRKGGVKHYHTGAPSVEAEPSTETVSESDMESFMEALVN